MSVAPQAATQLTPEQQAAIETRGVSVALDAGAGCGKTFVLTERFLSHLEPNKASEPPAELHELIAITFTDAAAREMRDRIRRACRDRLQMASGAAGDYWLSLLRTIDSARVNTIHGFCGSLVRSHAVELGIDPLFQVLDAGASDVLRSEVTDQSLRHRIADRDPVAMQLAVDFDLPGLKQRLWNLLDHCHEPEFAAWIAREPADMLAAWQLAYKRDYLPAMQQELVSATSFQRLCEVVPKATPVSEKFIEAYPPLTLLLQRFLDESATPEMFTELQELARTHGRKSKEEWPDQDIYQQYKQACEKVRALCKKCKPLAPNELATQSAQRGLELLRLTAAVADDYRAAKLERGVLDYDDLLVEARRLLTGDEFAAARSAQQQQVRLLLVDEFQDTDRAQVDIVKALVGSELATGRLFFVGDFKQSIYRFRGAEPDVFRELQEETPDSGRLPLATNFRSQPGVLEFVNRLVEPVFGEGYTPLRAARPQVTERPSAEFLWTTVAENASKPASRQAEARSIARRLRTLLNEQTPLVGEKTADGEWHARAVRPGDIAILFRTLSDVPYYEQALRDVQIDYQLIGGHAFYSQQEVFDIGNLLRTIASGCDEVALAGVLRSPFFSLHDESLFWLTRSPDGQTAVSLSVGFASGRVPKALDAEEAAKLQHARKTLQQLRLQKGQAPVSRLLSDAIEWTGYDAVLQSEFLGERKHANLHKLLEQARAFDAYRPGDLDGFVRQLSEFVAREPKEALAATRSGESDVVRLMTVHGSKGLEFPVVVLADINRKARGPTATAAFDAQLGPLVRSDDDNGAYAYGFDLHRAAEQAGDQAEFDRLFYVACTRAADHLILSAARPAGKAPEGEWLRTLDTHFDLETAAPRGEESDATAPLAIAHVADGKETNATPQKGVDRMRLLDKVAKSPASTPLPETLRPIALQADAIRRFSVSRLTGQLHHATKRPAAASLDAALRPAKEKVDPRGLGTLVHAVLERLSLDGDNAIAAWCEALASLHVNRHADLAALQATELVTRFTQSDRFHAMQSAQQVDREVEFLLSWPLGKPSGAYLQGYIDCLVQNAAGKW
ncbi:MAG: UvrD-helicase domain-containing protein, partial [Planctomycetota bacterium]